MLVAYIRANIAPALAAVQAEKYLDMLECALPGAGSAAGGSAAAPV